MKLPWIRFVALAAVLLGLGLATNAKADVITLTDHNSSVSIDNASQAGVYNWSVDGVNQLYQQWFWYRIGDAAGIGQQSIDTIGGASHSSSAPDNVDLVYQNNQLKAEVEYDLTGGNAGSGRSDLSEVIRLTNVSSSAYTLHFFQYSDFDLGANPAGDSVTIATILGKAYVATQVGNGKSYLSETVATPGADRWEANVYANTLNSLNGPANYDLNNKKTATGDATWAFEWTITLNPNDEFLISKDKQIRSVPEPSTLAIAGLGALGLIGYGIRRRRGS